MCGANALIRNTANLALIVLIVSGTIAVAATAAAEPPSLDAPQGTLPYWPNVETLIEPEPSSVGDSGSQFGWSVDMSGDLMVVGASGATNLSGSDVVTDSGSTYIFRRVGGAWVLEARLVSPEGAQASARFGFAVAVASTPNEVVVIGEPFRTDLDEEAGAVYIYERSNGEWQRVYQFISTFQGANCGYSVDTDGENVVVGRPVGINHLGDTILIQREGPSNWVLRQFRGSGEAEEGARFGESIAIGAGGYLVVGAPYATVDGKTFAGMAEIQNLQTDGGPLPASIVLKDPTPAANERFGRAVAASGGVFAIGSAMDDIPNGDANSGAVHVFRAENANVAFERTLRSPLPQSFAAFGSSLAFTGNRLAVGEPLRTVFIGSEIPGAGAAYVFRRIVLFDHPTWLHDAFVFNFGEGEAMGTSVAFANNILAAGVPYRDVGDDSGGAVALYRPDVIFADDFD